jgi:hypothetical protein
MRVGPFVRVGPFAFERLDEAFDLSVPARGVWRRGDVPGADRGELLLKGSAVAVAEGVVGHHSRRRLKPQLGEVGERSSEEARTGLASLVGMLLNVGVAAVVIDGGMHEDVAPATFVTPSRRRASADAMARPLECGQTGGIDVQQRPRLSPFVAASRH